MKNTLVSQQQSLARLCKVYCTIGWVDFALFSNFMKRHVACGSPWYNMGNYQIISILVQNRSIFSKKILASKKLKM